MKFKLLFIATILLVSCGKLGEKIKDEVAEKSNENVNDVGSVIAYNNFLVDYLNEASDLVKDAIEDAVEIKTIVNKKEIKGYYTGGDVFMRPTPDIHKKREGILLLEPDSNIPSEVKDSLVNNIKATAESFENIKKAYESFNKYLDSENFKDDDWAEGKKISEDLEKNIRSYYSNRTKVYGILEPLAIAAEIKLLEDHPLQETIIASKTDLGLVEEIVNMVYLQETVDMRALNSKYIALEANFKKNKGLTPDLLKKHKKNDFYSRFYKQLEEILGKIRKSKRDDKITESEANDIRSSYGYLVDRYNDFV